MSQKRKDRNIAFGEQNSKELYSEIINFYDVQIFDLLMEILTHKFTWQRNSTNTFCTFNNNTQITK